MDRLAFLDELPAARSTRSSICHPQQAARVRRKVSYEDGLVRDGQKELKANGEVLEENAVEFNDEELEDIKL